MPKQQEASVLPKKLTLSQLASYDDILTDALVDHVYFWTTIRKNRSKYNLTRGISEDEVTNILLHHVIMDKDVSKAETDLLQLPGLRKYHSALKTDREKEDFRRHMRKYISIWLPECPFEVSTTNRYTILTQEAAVTSRRVIRKGETVKYLVGNLVAMTAEEEQDLGLTRRDFSIVVSARRKTPSIFLGPARFANHDCKANARLVTCGPEGMQIIADQDIGIGDEITVTYGDNYFGEGNCECLCLTCEKAGRGAWAGPATSGCGTPFSKDEDEMPTMYALRNSTRKCSRLSGNFGTQSPALEHLTPSPNRKIKASGTQPALAAQASRGSTRVRKRRYWTDEGQLSTKGESVENVPQKRIKTGVSNPESKVPGSLRVEYRSPKAASLPSVQDQKHPIPLETSSSMSPMADAIFDELSAALKRRPAKVEASTKSTVVTGVTTEDNKRLELVPPTSTGNDAASSQDRPMETPISSSDHDSLFDNIKAQVSSQMTTPRYSEEPETKSILSSGGQMDVSDNELSELDPNVELDDISMTVVQKSPKGKRGGRGSKILPTIEIEDASLRYPGDYTRTALLLGEKYSRWVDCRTCAGCWVQQNGYQTRKECPRCERHSKLYGYQWPKTDKAGKDDEEERVMDHRTVHRFIKPDEERLLVKRGKGVNRTASEATTRTSSLAAEVENGPIARLRESRKRRRGSQLRA
ncbi:MAG: hypothetical protein Q9186_001641 [Xanthomendoza sp. 1 TL-2023]